MCTNPSIEFSVIFTGRHLCPPPRLRSACRQSRRPHLRPWVPRQSLNDIIISDISHNMAQINYVCEQINNNENNIQVQYYNSAVHEHIIHTSIAAAAEKKKRRKEEEEKVKKQLTRKNTSSTQVFQHAVAHLWHPCRCEFLRLDAK
jgi:hypothetical protein